ncbi:DJ-1/PfpI family protein [Aquabacterium sp.]|uniref:DJ-1/PfpI family protein n=1 Tax=Aquabacterium sp. TaxID=1872578 RepID=UPI0024875827|nr:DJ-1/PfpI family protein [Aquabacterium sp.]MDI1258320.1 DJ-1/PfpI family protein [Aquabacterium sp.]
MRNPPFIDAAMDSSLAAFGMLQADSMAAEPPSPVLASRRVAVLASDGLNEVQLDAVRRVLESGGAQVNVVSNRAGPLWGESGRQVPVDHHWLDMPSVMFDAVYVPGGIGSIAILQEDPDARHFMREAYEQGKSVAATGHGVELLREVGVPVPSRADEHTGNGIVTDLHGLALEHVAEQFIAAIVKDRHWRRGGEDRNAATSWSALPFNHGSEGSGPI